ncbi:hypothetical protein HRbin35_00341 [bacterium HR35]|nr:hypothetical protein HRbin35_00341 [bacterium HR35]
MKVKKDEFILKHFLKFGPKKVFIYGTKKLDDKYLVWQNNGQYEFCGGLWKKGEGLFEALRKRVWEKNKVLISKIRNLLKSKLKDGELYLFFEIEVEKNNLQNSLIFKNLKEISNPSKEIQIFLS